MIRSSVLPLTLTFALALGAIVIAIAGIASVHAQATPEARGYWPTDGWRTASPESQGMDADLAEQIEERIANETPLLSSMLVVKGGYLVYEGYFNGTERDDANTAASSSTSCRISISSSLRPPPTWLILKLTGNSGPAQSSKSSSSPRRLTNISFHES